MSQSCENQLKRLVEQGGSELLLETLIGIEKESLRVNQKGSIAQTSHPKVLGSALTHPYITTDYSEALLEFITPPQDSIRSTLDFLKKTHQYVYSHLDNETLWATSMPCVVEGDKGIPIAQYGSSNAGKMKTIYRVGLGHRYGRMMQVIAGVHFNFSLSDAFWELYKEVCESKQSLSDFRSMGYFSLIRNLQRLGWLIPYLFGASPVVCKTFLKGISTDLVKLDEYTYHYPFATSLRMGDIGYQNNQEAETGVKVSYDNLKSYVASLTHAIEAPCEQYKKLGVKVGGEYRQLNANMLQIENEYYSTVRPKQPLVGNEKPTLALHQRGVQYIELRSLDVNAFHPLGVDDRQLCFLEAFMIYCLLEESPMISHNEQKSIDRNEIQSAHQGRNPLLRLDQMGNSISLKDWALQICESMQGICEVLDRNNSDSPYSSALKQHMELVQHTELTPSARMMEEIQQSGESFFEYANRMSLEHQEFFKKSPLEDEQEQFFKRIATESLEQQREMEGNDHITFDEYLRNYFEQ